MVFGQVRIFSGQRKITALFWVAFIFWIMHVRAFGATQFLYCNVLESAEGVYQRLATESLANIWVNEFDRQGLRKRETGARWLKCDLLVGLRWWVKDLAGIGGWVEEKERESCGRQLPPGNCLPRVCGGNKGLERWLRVMLMRRRRKKTLNLDGEVALYSSSRLWQLLFSRGRSNSPMLVRPAVLGGSRARQLMFPCSFSVQTYNANKMRSYQEKKALGIRYKMVMVFRLDL